MLYHPHLRRSILASCILLIVFVGAVLLQDRPFHEPLLPWFNDEPSRSDVVLAHAARIEGTLTTLPSGNSSYVIEGTVLIPRNTTITLRDVTIAAGTDARLIVEGTLTLEHATMFANALHPEKSRWHGLLAQKGGRIEATDLRLANATSALTCGQRGSVTLAESMLSRNLAGIVSLPEGTCVIRRSSISEGRIGLHMIGGTADMRDTRLSHLLDGIRAVAPVHPQTANITFDRVTEQIRTVSGTDLL